MSISGGLPNGVFASPGDAFGLLFHGTADGVVPSSWSNQTAAKMLEAGVPAWLQHQQGAGHVPWGQYRTLYLEQASYFLYLALDLAHAAGQPPAAARAAQRQLERAGREPAGEAAPEDPPEAEAAGEARTRLAR